MKSQFKFSGKLTVAVMLVSILALSATATPQTTSNASLADTLNWLQSFLPTATGVRVPITSDVWSQTTDSIATVNGCSLTLLEQTTQSNYQPGRVDSTTYTFSLSDIDPSSTQVKPLAPDFLVSLQTRGQAMLVKEGGDLHNVISFVPVGEFADQASAQRVVNAFQHAAQLCANAQPF